MRSNRRLAFIAPRVPRLQVVSLALVAAQSEFFGADGTPIA
jgi:hypothetical protein